VITYFLAVEQVLDLVYQLLITLQSQELVMVVVVEGLMPFLQGYLAQVVVVVALLLNILTLPLSPALNHTQLVQAVLPQHPEEVAQQV
jgi:ABC-type bacteriocin/lantibiotic exporter with double-glycine peptidase domain